MSKTPTRKDKDPVLKEKKEPEQVFYLNYMGKPCKTPKKVTVTSVDLKARTITDTYGFTWSLLDGQCITPNALRYEGHTLAGLEPENITPVKPVGLGPFKPGDQLSVTDLQGIPRIVIQVASVSDGCTLTDTLGNTWSRINGACIDGPHILLHQDLTIEGVLDAKPAEKAIPPLLGNPNPNHKPATNYSIAYTWTAKGLFQARYGEPSPGQFLWTIILNTAGTRETVLTSGKSTSEADAINACNQAAKAIAQDMLELANLQP